MATQYDFCEQRAFSKANQDLDQAMIRSALGKSCSRVDVTPLSSDRRGVDFIARLRGGAELGIDVKRRVAGCSRFWTDGPELALEIWSVMPVGNKPGLAGWTLDESKITDYTLHVFDPADWEKSFLLPFQLLRMAFRRNLRSWQKRFPGAIQPNKDWDGECLFVPEQVVREAILAEMLLR